MSEEKRDVLGDFLDGKPFDPSAEEELRDELRLAVSTLSMIRESLSRLSTEADERSRRAGETGETSDAWLLGYAAGRAREGQAHCAVIGALQNSMDIWATTPRQTGGAT